MKEDPKLYMANTGYYVEVLIDKNGNIHEHAQNLWQLLYIDTNYKEQYIRKQNPNMWVPLMPNYGATKDKLDLTIPASTDTMESRFMYFKSINDANEYLGTNFPKSPLELI